LVSGVDALLGLRIYFGTAPVFVFSVLIYTAQTLACVYIFRRLGALGAIGHAALLSFASYSGYELAFKVSFLAFGSSQVDYFMSYDLYPATVFTFALVSLLAIKDRVNARAFLTILGVCGVVWVGWLLSGAFPTDVQRYELDPAGNALLFNFLTKLLFSLAFVVGAAIGARSDVRKYVSQQSNASRQHS